MMYSLFNMKKEPEPVKKIMQDYLFLDTGGTKGIANNPKFVTNIKQSNNPIELETTGGTKIEDKATIPGYKGHIWYDKEAPISTLSFGKLVQEPNIDKITYDSSKEDAFNIIHTKDAGIIKFKCMPNGLYAFKPTIDCTKAKNNNSMPAKTPNKITNKANKAANDSNIKKNKPHKSYKAVLVNHQESEGSTLPLQECVGQKYHINGQMDRQVPLRTQVMNEAHLCSSHSFM
jgi:hypothetical protein